MIMNGNLTVSHENKLEEIDSPFDPKKVNITTKQMTLSLLFARLANNEVDLETPFQRNPNLWDKKKQSRLIESILIKLPLPAFYFDGSDDDKWLVVDGLQRLSTFRNFVVERESPLKLSGLEFLTQFNGYNYDELPRDLQRRIREHEITAYIINPGTPSDVKYNLFRRINTAGLTLTQQEIRHALNQGVPAKFIAELAEIPEFKQLKISTKRMRDRDFVNRFIAFYIYPLNVYNSDLDAFLHKSMNKLGELSAEEQDTIKRDFTKALVTAHQIFGDDAFRKKPSYRSAYRSQINKALFEVWTVNLSKLTVEQLNTLVEYKDLVNQKFSTLQDDFRFNNAISNSTGDRRQVLTRFSAIESLINEVLA